MAYFERAEDVYETIGKQLTDLTSGNDDLTAVARGEIRAEGPVAKLFRLVPLAKPVFPRYRRQLVDQGRPELAAL